MHHDAIPIAAAGGQQLSKTLRGAGEVRLHRPPLAGFLAVGAFAVLTVIYFSYRIPLWNPAAPVMSSVLLGAELFGTMTLALHVISTWCLVERRAPPPPLGYEADIFITTWNESAQILRYTLLAAKQVRHARKIWLLDDGGRGEMAELAAELGVEYLSRTDRAHAKAGNLNNALRHTDADFVAIFDCDHAPSPEFLERTLGYFLDPVVALVQTPQDFYNVDSFQHRASAEKREAWHEQTLFYRVIQAGKDYWNATFFCGSCAIIRREALEDIGGIATGTITEDMHTSLRLHKHGWAGVYHAEALAFGLSPTNLEQYETQRLRWGRGAMQVWAKEGIVLTRGLTLAQRIAYLTSAITYFEGWQKGIVYIMPIVVMMTGWMPIVWTGWPFLLLFSGWLLSGMLVNEVFSRGYAKTIYMEEYNFLRFYTFIKATLALVIPLNWGFAVTPKTLTSSDRVPARLWPQLLVAGCAIASIPLGLAMYHAHSYLPAGAFAANLVWVTLTAAIAIKALRFATRRLQQRRTDHRFAIPLTAILDVQDASAAGLPVIAEDISSNGFSFRIPDERQLPSVLSGELALPGGPLPFTAEVVSSFSSDATSDRRVALRFRWAKPADADPLNRCLYGNTLQWDVNAWSETRRAAFDLPWPGKRRSREEQLAWKFAEVRAAGSKGVPCIARREADAFRILALEALPGASGLTLAESAPGSPSSGLRVAGYRTYSVGGGLVHMAVVARAEQAPAINYHREPTWTRETGRA